MSKRRAAGPLNDFLADVLFHGSEAEMRQIATLVFPPGSLLDDAPFTVRELEIIKTRHNATSHLSSTISTASALDNSSSA